MARWFVEPRWAGACIPRMFVGAAAFNSDLSNRNLEKVTTIEGMSKPNGRLRPIDGEVRSIELWCTQRGRLMIRTQLRRCCNSPVPILRTMRRCRHDTSNTVRRCSDDAATILARALRSCCCEGAEATTCCVDDGSGKARAGERPLRDKAAGGYRSEGL